MDWRQVGVGDQPIGEGGHPLWLTRGMSHADRWEQHQFPHGPCDVREAALRFVKEFRKPTGFLSPKLVLRSFRLHYGRSGAGLAPELLSTRPWDRNPARSAPPQGYYEGATGTTSLWVEYFRVVEEHLADPGKTAVTRPGVFLEVSNLTWSYPEMGDYETSFVIGIRETSAGPTEATVEAATFLMERISALLQAHPAPPQSFERRRAREERIQAALRAQEEQNQQEREAAAAAARDKSAAADLRRKLLESSPGRTLAVIYDTSYLAEGRRELLSALSKIHATKLVSFLSQEAIEEVRHLFEDADGAKALLASKARSRMTMLRERRDFHHEVRDVRLADWVRPREYPDSIGSISSVDSLLMEFGKYLLDHDRFRAVVIASLDGGIRDLVIRYRQQSGRALFCVSDPRDANQTGAINAFLDRAQGMTAHIERVAALPQVERDGVTGFQISVELCIAGCRGLPCSALVLFTTSDGRPLLDQNGGFVNAWGEVAVGCDFVPSHDPVVVGVTELHIPYSEWHLAPGRHDLRWRVGVFGPHGCLAWSEDQILTVNQGA